MDQTGDLAAVFALDRQHEPPVTQRDGGVLQILLHGLVADHLVERLTQVGPRAQELAAHLGEGGTRGVRQLLLGDDGALEGRQQGIVRHDEREEVVERRRRLAAMAVPLVERLCLPEQVLDVHEVTQREPCAGRRARDHIANVLESLERRRAELHREPQGVVRFQRLLPHDGEVRGGTRLQHHAAARLVRRERGRACQYLVQFQDLFKWLHIASFIYVSKDVSKMIGHAHSPRGCGGRCHGWGVRLSTIWR